MTRRFVILSLLALYLAALAASHVVRAFHTPPKPSGRDSTPVREVEIASDGKIVLGKRPVTIAWRQWTPATASGRQPTPIVLLHGSPGSANDFLTLGPALAADRAVIAPDLPGFGGSTRDVANYSIRAHAAYVCQLLDHLGIERVHVLGFSMGGGVALEIARQQPRRLASLTLLSAIGVQELEWLGDYRLNHALHGLQLLAIAGLREGTPHFGLLDSSPLGWPYARNFFDSDQRPLRLALLALKVPVLIVHGERDPLIPIAAAREHHRLVPQSELLVLDRSHFYVFRHGDDVAAPPVADFLRRVDAGAATFRGEVSPERLAAALRPFDPSSIPAWSGPGLVVVLFFLALATLVTEDLSCIGGGLLVAQGRLPFWPTVLALSLGILVGDILLFLAGRILGRTAVRGRPLRYWIKEEAIENSSAWLRRRGPAVILLSRFLPGARLPTYFAAGVLRTSFLKFSFYFALAVAVWTPILVGFSRGMGDVALETMDSLEEGLLTLVLLAIVILFLVRGLLVPLLSHRGRRKAWGRLRRWLRWEFWPPWLFYPPFFPYLLWLGLKHRHLTVFTAANPMLEGGGFIGESKELILKQLQRTRAPIPRWQIVDGQRSDAAQEVLAFVERESVDFPIVLKPNTGERGQEVAIAHSPEEVHRYFHTGRGATLVQQYIGGREYGVFYYRHPGDDTGQILGITEKVMPTVTGDGEKTVERLILDDPRAVQLLSTYLHEVGLPADSVPPANSTVRLATVGAHCRGTIFRDGSQLVTPALVQEITRISRDLEGFDFGRYDLKTESEEALRAGGPFVILELNGVTSEATHMYDSRYGLLDAYSILARQWRLAYAIGAARRQRGGKPVGLIDLVRMWLRERRNRHRRRRLATARSLDPIKS